MLAQCLLLALYCIPTEASHRFTFRLERMLLPAPRIPAGVAHPADGRLRRLPPGCVDRRGPDGMATGERRSANWLQGSPDPCWLALRALPGPESPQLYLLGRGGALVDDLSADDGDGGLDGEDVRFRDSHDVAREAGEVGELAGFDGAEVPFLE
jgi:hypothetical protein